MGGLYLLIFLYPAPSVLLYKDFILILERGEGREKERERNIKWLPLMRPPPPSGTQPATQACAPTHSGTGNLLARKVTLSPPSYTSQGPVCFLTWYSVNPCSGNTQMEVWPIHSGVHTNLLMPSENYLWVETLGQLPNQGDSILWSYIADGTLFLSFFFFFFFFFLLKTLSKF